MSIPKIIHQIWLGDQAQRPQRWIDTWIRAHPDWQHHVWTEANLPALQNERQYATMPAYCGRADIVRYELLHQFGGVYIDADSECIAPLSDDLLQNAGFAVHENEYVRPGLIANGVIGVRPGHALMRDMMNAIAKLGDLSQLAPADVWKTTGPLAFTRMIGTRGHTSIRLYPSYWFYPEHYTGTTYTGYVDRAYAKQYWGSSRPDVYRDAAVRNST
jgi:mannosyltransferase OCH1-like enzyme